jgi:hypothetical protein
LAPGVVCCRCQLHCEIKETFRLAIEKSVGREGLDGGYRTPYRGRCGANDGTGRQCFFEKEIARLRQDLVGLGELKL